MRTKAAYRIGRDNEFIIENYNYSKAFASFLPGIAGVDGIPMWVFYVNRNQAVCSIGIETKERSMMEFLPANFAYQLVGSEGFRTFIKINSSNGFTLYEPFRTYEKEEKYIPAQTMTITPYSVTLNEVHEKLGIAVEVKYFNVVQEPFSGLVRRVEIKNISKKPAKFELLDGLPMVVPFGLDDFSLKKMRYLAKSYGFVENLENKIPFFHIKTGHEDGPEVAVIKRGHFFACLKTTGNKTELVRPLVDMVQIFGERKDYIVPSEFNVKAKFSYDFKNEVTSGEFPSAMCYERITLKPSAAITLCGVCGTVDSIAGTAKVKQALSADFITNQLEKNRSLVESLMSNSLVIGEDNKLNRYAGQNYLDNVLRGGFPVTVAKDSKKVFYVYSRKHGDLERDYNQYYLSPTPYSQGDASYRDVNQNRRNDNFFNPDVGVTNIVNYINLLQMDGFNPNVVGGISYLYNGGRKPLETMFSDKIDLAEGFLKKPFTPGDLFKFIDSNSIKTKFSRPELFSKMVGHCEAIQNCRHEEGYWTDHWHYNLDLIDSYFSIYPEKAKELFFGMREFTFYDNPNIVMPRQDKYVIWDGKAVQLGSVWLDPEKKKLISQRDSDKNRVRTLNGKGEVYKTNLITKLFIIAVNKLNSIGPDGCGIEMDTDKPNWNDALNGLPGLFGSSTNETLELRRLITVLSDNLKGESIDLPEEVVEAVNRSKGVIKDYLEGKSDDYAVWDGMTSIKEDFRARTRLGISGKFENVPAAEISGYLDLAAKRTDAAIEKSIDKKSGLYYGYFRSIPVEYDRLTTVDENGKTVAKTNHKGLQCIKVKKFKSVPLPVFLEAQVHAMRIDGKKDAAGKLHTNLLKSGLFDSKLKMFALNESLENEPYEIGRNKTFSPGWLENQSIWLHMEYKYILELLKAGLYDEFFASIKGALIPYLKPEVYGRSIFENSSFIASSAHPDKKIHGNGFYARLSGSSAEFVHMWIIMMTGGRPFVIDASGKIVFKLSPVLKGEMFLKKDRAVNYYLPDGTLKKETLKKGTLKFVFLGAIPVTYINPGMKDLLGEKSGRAAKYTLTLESGDIKEFSGSVPEPYSVMIRERKVKEITVSF